MKVDIFKVYFTIKEKGGQEYTDINKCYIIIKARVYLFKKINYIQEFLSHLCLKTIKM